MADADDLTGYEWWVLSMLDGSVAGEWGAWVSACLEYLEFCGYCSRGPHYLITDRGRQAMDERAKP